jgi:hypothetical protein
MDQRLAPAANRFIARGLPGARCLDKIMLLERGKRLIRLARAAHLTQDHIYIPPFTARTCPVM